MRELDDLLPLSRRIESSEGTRGIRDFCQLFSLFFPAQMSSGKISNKLSKSAWNGESSTSNSLICLFFSFSPVRTWWFSPGFRIEEKGFSVCIADCYSCSLSPPTPAS